MLVSAVFPIRSHLQVHGGHEFRGTLFTPAHYPGGHTLAACLHLGYQGAGIWVPLPLLTQVSFLKARPTRSGFPPKWGMSGSLTVKNGRLFPTKWPDGSNEYTSSISINLEVTVSLILVFCFYFCYLFSLFLDYLLASLGSSLRSMRAFSSCKGPLFLAVCGLLIVMVLLLCSASSRTWAQQLWCTNLVSPKYVGSSWIRDQNCVPRIARWILFFFFFPFFHLFLLVGG